MTKLKEAFACYDFEVLTNLQSGKVMGNVFTATTASINQSMQSISHISDLWGSFIFILFVAIRFPYKMYNGSITVRWF